MGKVEVELAVEGHPEGGQDEEGQVPGRGERQLVGQEGDLPGGAAMDVDGLPHRELGHGSKSVDILGCPKTCPLIMFKVLKTCPILYLLP